MTESQRLLAEFARSRSETAFSELVGSYINLVFSTALRITGDVHRAEDIAQTVFVDLANTAGRLPKNTLLGGWLHRHTCYVSLTAMRAERRRQFRENIASHMHLSEDHTEANLALIRPILDSAIDKLGHEERSVIILRFFDQLGFREIAETIGTSEEAAQKRANRAVEKLRAILARESLQLSAVAVTSVLMAEGSSAAPVGLGVAVANTAFISLAAKSATTGKLAILTMTKLKMGLATAICLGGIATPLLFQMQTNSRLRVENELLRQQMAKSQGSPNERSNPSTPIQKESGFLWKDVESSDIAQYAAHLRAAGCPESTVALIIRAEADRIYDDNLSKTFQRDFKYWHTSSSEEKIAPGLKQQLLLISAERNQLLKSLNVEPSKDFEQYLLNRDFGAEKLAFLPETTRQQAVDVIRDHQKQLDEIHKAWGQGLLLNPEEKLRQVTRDQMAKLQEFLSPGDVFEAAIRFSEVSDSLRCMLNGFEPSEAEYRAIFSYPLEYYQNRAEYKDFQSLLGEVLSPERFQEYQRGQSDDYQQLFKWAETKGAGRQTAVDLVRLQDSAMENVTSLRDVQKSDPVGLEKALGELRNATYAKMEAVMGQTEFSDYLSRTPQLRDSFGLKPDRKLGQPLF